MPNPDTTRPYYGDRITPGQAGPHPDPLTDDALRADTLNAAIDYAIEQGFEGMAWLAAWREGDADAMADLDRWRKEQTP